jgi:hypothetical protein
VALLVLIRLCLTMCRPSDSLTGESKAARLGTLSEAGLFAYQSLRTVSTRSAAAVVDLAGTVIEFLSDQLIVEGRPPENDKKVELHDAIIHPWGSRVQTLRRYTFADDAWWLCGPGIRCSSLAHWGLRRGCGCHTWDTAKTVSRLPQSSSHPSLPGVQGNWVPKRLHMLVEDIGVSPPGADGSWRFSTTISGLAINKDFRRAGYMDFPRHDRVTPAANGAGGLRRNWRPGAMSGVTPTCNTWSSTRNV